MRDPYDGIDGGQPLTVTSSDFDDGARLPLECTAAFNAGKDVSPELSWSAVPEGTKSIYVHVFDPDAPTPAGWWHWSVVNLPPNLTSLPRDANGQLPDGAIALRHDGGGRGYLGSAPPPGHGPHRYFFTVHALDAVLDVDEDTTATAAAFQAREHVLARGSIVGTWQN
ncbi:YbhB/YbcL family Raf kinase inhibitor-like protein [uncultured Tessaracoccus sp.]|uniref:YbhB/YbcL family Raf kinase inhibitor-like protein n=1 Tax=uncultured Tessaracoccus sp. TaxID=905023 RepID=UPI0025CDEA95|nr:YbhB/YbcL family Raf kinase inhibitor-like protein [uncultured Tessaracoccus sp.]